MNNQRKNKKKKSHPFLRYLLFFACIVFVLTAFWMAGDLSKRTHHVRAESGESGSRQDASDSQGNDNTAKADDAKGQDGGSEPKAEKATETGETVELTDEITSSSAVLVDLSTEKIVAQRDANARISPASMTKILTILVAAEHVENLDDTFTITQEIVDYSYLNECSSAGFVANDVVTVRDLFYGTILPSGGDAATALAIYVAGSLEDFVGLMNEKLKELGLSKTAHFTNSAGLYDEDHYCTVYDMALILQAAVANDLCRDVLSARTYQIPASELHPEGILISNWFLRRIEDKDTGARVMCAKTGYVEQAGNCSASYGVGSDGKEYICVTANAAGVWACIDDHVALYRKFSA
ncbi:serine hydrolase [Ruminococcus sp. OA3]|uniref:D-alanyl-D-alanine carboxypeptidase family protein n=1 Tax=Ruminococcus sp. OA3 TaxID=2914164 RepID=UPI001F055FD6|nr:serine hydrolase [Ruminococcus sp. OA3]MCH1983028.1 serine hydrolase [Ruminococcus sp. OA3]